MGFRPEPTIYNIAFEGTPLDGLHVRASACTVGEYEKMLRLIVDAPGPDESEEEKAKRRLTPEILDNNDWIVQLFANHLVSWDLEDYIDGTPIPTTLEGIRSQERGLIAQIMQAWQIAIVAVPKALNENSNNGAISPEQSLDLGSLSESPGS